MVKLAIDENFNRDIVRGVLRRRPGLDLVSTMTRFAYERIIAGLPMPGVFEVSPSVPVRDVIEEMLLIAEASAEGEWEGQVRYLPLR